MEDPHQLRLYLRSSNKAQNSHDDYDATGIYNPSTREFTLLAGSKIRLNSAPTLLLPKFKKNLAQRIQLLTEFPSGIMERDIIFPAPSPAAEVVAGRSMNGWDKWKTSMSKSLKEVFGLSERDDFTAEDDLSVLPTQQLEYCWLLSTKEREWQTYVDKKEWQYQSNVEKQLQKLHQIQPDDWVVLQWTKPTTLEHDNRSIHNVSTIHIKAIGKVLAPVDKENRLHIDWLIVYEQPRLWYFYSLPGASIWYISYSPIKDSQGQPKLIDFIFNGEEQDIDYFINDPFWHKRYGGIPEEQPLPLLPEFLDDKFFDSYLQILKEKKNLILQGSPGTGKTWLANRLAKAITADPSCIMKIQFHQNFSYEEFVQGYRPNIHQQLELQDGKMLQLIDQALADRFTPHVLIIDEINRGNPSSIFGELLTLLEHTKRSANYAISLAYGQKVIYIPENIYIIGTMNLADHSLAHLDIALRRRFAFVNLLPLFNEAWANHLKTVSRDQDHHLIDQIKNKLLMLNHQIEQDGNLGRHFIIGHSFFTTITQIESLAQWFERIIESEITSLLQEYWLHDEQRVVQTLEQLKL